MSHAFQANPDAHASNANTNVDHAANTVNEEAYSHSLKLALQLLTIPDGYSLKRVQSEQQNGNDVWWFRYEKASAENNGVGGEHFSFVVSKNSNKLLGFTWMDKSLLNGELPTKEAAKEIAKAFLDKVESGLFVKLDNLWIDKHDESIMIKNAEKLDNIIISGIKYKCYLKENHDYAWVIVGRNGEVITFEQGIQWVNGRVTEKWLHDSWVQEK
ncbi:YcdB/YcdC domain-containing protein [Cohnella abietis]|uniref:YcdB/YcdC repeated domain-containing protein n=1 Tax=Cohnella abietis TaxID=2507935 RepID=A0A3T1DBT0_9BACL|nr:YcdB/YcdC domain-containing protein [Cohnella abietis]BBI35601.1 hypothetical protein KCTCHS21_50000 [Cohnella abietis]